MRARRFLEATTALATALTLLLVLAVSAEAQRRRTPELESVKTSTAPQLDGEVDEVWANAETLEIEVDELPYESNTYDGITETTVRARSLYDGEYVYFLFQWDDPSKSLARYPWIKQDDGSWKQKKNKDQTNHENTYYEDKFAVLWDINTDGFNKKGCGVACHKARDGQINGYDAGSPGRKFTDNPGEFLDAWHWKSVRTGPVGQVDDKHFDHTPKPGWGRKGDNKTGGGYSDNVDKENNRPKFMSSEPLEEDQYWIHMENAVPFDDSKFKPGDMVPAMLVSPFQGARGEVLAEARWEDGTWTLEVRRKLVTTGPKSKQHDVQFDDLKKDYYFGVAVFDNTQIAHVYHEGAKKLVFK